MTFNAITTGTPEQIVLDETTSLRSVSSRRTSAAVLAVLTPQSDPRLGVVLATSNYETANRATRRARLGD
jgi:hypothetical protein